MNAAMIVHDALAEASNSDELYSLIYEHYQDACCNNPCSHGFNVCARLIGSIVIDAIRKHEKRENPANDCAPDDWKSELIAEYGDNVNFAGAVK